MSTKDLGVVFDYKLTFSEQCHNMANEGFARFIHFYVVFIHVFVTCTN